jgi:hypothetical protein
MVQTVADDNRMYTDADIMTLAMVQTRQVKLSLPTKDDKLQQNQSQAN